MNILEKQFFEFIYQRHLIWYKRFILKEQPPWTSDRILSTYKIINMYRELDACTIYPVKKFNNILDRQALILNIVFYRFFNQRELYENLHIEPFPSIDNSIKQQIIYSFEEMKKSNLPLFNNAYLISSGQKGQQKHISILNNLQNTNWQSIIQKIDSSKTPRDSLNIIQTIPMVGPFLACEIWTDLSYFHFFKQNWTDNDFVNIGPGAKWGLEILAQKKLSNNEQEEYLHHLHKVQETILPTINQDLHLPLEWKTIAFKEASSNVPFLSLTNIEGALCEFRKYHRLQQGKGKRRYFHPMEKLINNGKL